MRSASKGNFYKFTKCPFFSDIPLPLETWFPQPRKYYFPGQSIQDLKVINQDTC